MASALALVLVILLASGEDPRDVSAWIRFAGIAFLASLIALSAALLLCRMRPLFLRLPAAAGVPLALLTVASLAFAETLAAAWAARELIPELGLNGRPVIPLALRAALLALLGAAVALRYFFVLERWRAGVESQARAEMEALQARIHPHFLFNTMNSIASLIAIDPERAERAVEDFSDLMRAALGRRASHSLGEELELVRRYLAIEQIRLGERLIVRMSVEEAPLELEIPALLIQPLVENAVLHGIQNRAEGGVVTIEARREGERLRILVSNPLPAKGNLVAGFGMAHENVRRRLELRYGRRASLRAREEAGYYACELSVPLT
ncbi:MAG: histidine kinase [Lysobacterales bacterium]|jgi:two-component system sensor histidine kinase AlgZ|nr:MAG: histidine kinase [Xanthomonadales bacterium]